MSKELSCTYTTDCYPAIERYELLISSAMCLHLKNVMLSKRSQTQKTVVYCMIPFICNSEKGKPTVTERRWGGFRWPRGGGRDWLQRGLDAREVLVLLKCSVSWLWWQVQNYNYLNSDCTSKVGAFYYIQIIPQ